MDRESTEVPMPPQEDRDQVVVMHNVSWSLYQGLLAAQPTSRPRMAFLEGELELIAPSRRHEVVKTMIARLLECYVEETGGSFNGIGEAMLLQETAEAWIQPDEAYFVGPVRELPDLAIEVVLTHGGTTS